MPQTSGGRVARLACSIVVCAVTSLTSPTMAREQRRVDGPLDPALLAGLRWRSIGPANMGGRVDDIAVN